MYSPTNGVTKGTISSYSALVGVMLSDVDAESWGNLALWPGTHRLNGAYFSEHGPQSLLDGMPAVELPTPVQLTGQAGDAVLCHYLLSHGISVNVGPRVRYAIYFRLRHVDHEAHNWQSMVDPWYEWDGIRPVASV
jgi:ectoine hydroxylase-related dioxygenase (phytanoyl-CoA dioxygenase family)